LCEHRAGCRLPPALLLSRRNQSPDTLRSRNLSKSAPAHDAVAAAVSHKHHSIIRVGAGLIQFVYGLHSKRGHGAHFIKYSVCAIFPRKRNLYFECLGCCPQLLGMEQSCQQSAKYAQIAPAI